MSTWELDPAHSQIEFAVRHMMVTTVRGQFRKFDVAVNFDEADPEHSTVEAHIDATSIDTGMDARDAHLRGADFFDAGTYPELSFRSTRIERSSGAYTIEGDLTMHGQTRPVRLDAEIGGIVPNMQGGRRAGFSASTKISRKAWGLTWNGALESGGVLVGDDIKITMDLAVLQPETAAPNVPAGVALGIGGPEARLSRPRRAADRSVPAIAGPSERCPRRGWSS
jgi:polyisoprenoid-binding protein YceI